MPSEPEPTCDIPQRDASVKLGPPRLSIGLIAWSITFVAVFLVVLREHLVLQDVPMLIQVVDNSFVLLSAVILSMLPVYPFYWLRGKRWRPEPGEFLLFALMIDALKGIAFSILIDFLPIFEAGLETLRIVMNTSNVLIAITFLTAAWIRRQDLIWYLLFWVGFVAAMTQPLFSKFDLLSELDIFVAMAALDWALLSLKIASVALGVTIALIALTVDLVRKRMRTWLHWFGVAAMGLVVGQHFFPFALEALLKANAIP